MVRVLPRRRPDVRYLTEDRALELDGVREGPARWSPLPGREIDSHAVLTPRARGGVIGYDLIVAAPRPASILLAVGTEREQRALVEAHRAAVTDALTYLDQRATVVRRVVLGDEELIGARLPGAVSFTHGVSRAREPHLHDHVLIPSTVTQSGRALEGWSLRANLAAADALYRARLRLELGERTGRASWRSLRGLDHVEGIDEGLRALWPGHADDRGAKWSPSRAETVATWAADLRRFETSVTLRPPTRGRGHLDEHAFSGAFEGRVTIHRPTVVAAWADAATFGTTRAAVEAAVDRWYPELARARGREGPALTTERARMIGHVNERGPRELEPAPQRQRSRERELR